MASIWIEVHRIRNSLGNGVPADFIVARARSASAFGVTFGIYVPAAMSVGHREWKGKALSSIRLTGALFNRFNNQMENNRTIKSHRPAKIFCEFAAARPSSTVRVTVALRACNVRPRAVITKAQSRPTFNRAAKLSSYIWTTIYSNIINISDNNRDYKFFFVFIFVSFWSYWAIKLLTLITKTFKKRQIFVLFRWWVWGFWMVKFRRNFLLSFDWNRYRNSK